MHAPRDPWLTALLNRGGQVQTTHPWRAEGAADGRALREGLLQRVVADVVVPADLEVDHALRAHALDLLLPPGVVVLATAALWVHLGPPLASPQEVQVASTRLPDLTCAPGLPLRFTRARPAAEDITRIGPLALTTPARSLLDLAAAHPHRAARMHEVLREAGLLDDDALGGSSRRGRGRAGIRTARRALRIPRAGHPELTPGGEDGGSPRLSPSAGARP